MACGAPAPVAAWQQPPYPPQQGYYGQPGMPYGQPMGYGQPYMMMPVPVRPPSKKMAIAGGVLSLIGCAIVVLLSIWALGNADFKHTDAASGMVYVTLVVTLAAGLMSVFAIQGKWWGALVAGILQTLNVIMTLLCCGAAQAARTHLIFEDVFLESDRSKALQAISTAFACSVLVVLVAAIFCYIGISGAKQWARYRTHMKATETF
jgi:uncharacterized membrane protein